MSKNRLYGRAGLSLAVLMVLVLFGVRLIRAQDAPVVSFTIAPQEERQPISPYIYGTNQDLEGFEHWTFRRLGGNRTTGYNWETNASNAGADWHHVNDGWLCSVIGVSAVDCRKEPAAVMRTYHEQSLAIGAESLITLQMAGFVSADFNNEVGEDETAPSARWVPVTYAKGAPFDDPPDRQDGAVYMDELVYWLVSRYGSALTERGIMAYSLDNEPALWSHTHPRIHPEPVKAKELVDRSIALSTAVKAVDPDALIFGPALYGFNAYRSLQDAPDWPELQRAGAYDWFIDYYLEQMAKAETEQGKRLLDVLDVHWYSEAQGNSQRIVMGGEADGAGSDAVRYARMQAPRTFWDASYRENSWIAKYNPQYLPILPKLMASIERYYPGTRLAVTEWGFGGENDVSGGIAAADVLGIFGREGVFAAAHWSTEPQSDYISAAYALFGNYDGQGGSFGDLSIKAETSRTDLGSIYAAMDEENQQLHVIVLNKSLDFPLEGQFSIDDQQQYTLLSAWGFDDSSAVMKALPAEAAVRDNQFSYTLPPLSATHFILGIEQPAGLDRVLEIILVIGGVVGLVAGANTLRISLKASIENFMEKRKKDRP